MRVRYGKPIKVISLAGDQTHIIKSSSYTWVGLKDNYFGDMNSGTNIICPVVSGNRYFYAIHCPTHDLSSYNPTFGLSGSTSYQPGNLVSLGNSWYGLAFTSTRDIETFNGIGMYRSWTDIFDSMIIDAYFILDLTNTELETLTTEQLNKYNKYFSLIATGEEITIDNKAGQIAYKNLEEDSIRCKVAGGSSDVYYGYNQLCSSSFDTATGWGVHYGTLTANDGVATFTLTQDAQYNTGFGVETSTNNIAGHIYLLLASVKHMTAGLSFKFRQDDNYSSAFSSTTEYQNVSWIHTSTGKAWHNYQLIFDSGQNGEVINVKNCMNIDLTDWFGAGKEPSTAQEFKEKFTKEYYGFCPTPIKLTRYQIEALPTYGYNQLFKVFQNFTAPAGTTKTLSSDNLSVTITGTSTNGINTMLTPQVSGQTFIEGHKYLGLVTLNGTVDMSNDGWSFRFGRGSQNILRPFVQNQLNTFNNDIKSIFFTYLSNDSLVGLYSYFSIGSTYNITISNPMLIDLTDWYGEGNEPTTIEEFKATFPNLYYPYSKKRLLNKYMINKLIN